MLIDTVPAVNARLGMVRFEFELTGDLSPKRSTATAGER